MINTQIFTLSNLLIDTSKGYQKQTKNFNFSNFALKNPSQK